MLYPPGPSRLEGIRLEDVRELRNYLRARSCPSYPSFLPSKGTLRAGGRQVGVSLLPLRCKLRNIKPIGVFRQVLQGLLEPNLRRSGLQGQAGGIMGSSAAPCEHSSGLTFRRNLDD